MASASSKLIPFLVLLIAGGFGAVETFTEFTITPEMVRLLVTILTPMGVGGLVNKTFDSWKTVNTAKIPNGE
jgi:predicted Na+-dependent transporter